MPAVVIGESVLVDETLDDHEALRVFLEVAQERLHSAPSVVVDDSGRVLTDPRYVDRMGAVHPGAGAWAFCRRPAAEALGLPAGTDWVRDHAPYLMFMAGSPFLPAPHLYDQLYLQAVGDSHPRPLEPLCTAGPVAWRNSGTHICVLEERVGSWVDAASTPRFLLWEYDPTLARRRVVTAFPTSAKLSFVELAYSPDDAWIHLCDGMSGRNLLVRVSDGATLTLPLRSTAMSWNPRQGASAMIAMVPEEGTTKLGVYDYDLSTNRWCKRSEVASPHDSPMTVRGLSMSVDGRAALVTAPIASSGLDQRRRGGVHLAVVIDVEGTEITPVLPVAFRTAGAQRRHTSPRWCEGPLTTDPGPTQVADELAMTTMPGVAVPGSRAVDEDRLQRWLETAEGIMQAWGSERMPTARFADEFVQHLLSAHEIDERAAGVLAERLPRTSPLRGQIRYARETSRRPSGISPEPAESIARPIPRVAAALAASDVPGLCSVPTTIINARSSIDLSRAVGWLLNLTSRLGVGGRETWSGLMQLGGHSLRSNDHVTALCCALFAIRWREHLQRDPQLASIGLRPAPRTVELELVVIGFEALTRLGRTSIAHSALADGPDAIRSTLMHRLEALSVGTYLRTGRPRSSTDRTYTLAAAPDPWEYSADGLRARSTKKRVFVSHVHENRVVVDRLAEAIEKAGYEVWIYRKDLLPGTWWKSEVKTAIRAGDYFMACFSSAFSVKTGSYMQDELDIAVEQLRLMPRRQGWFLPVKLDECAIPDLPIGLGRTLGDIDVVSLADGEAAATIEILAALGSPRWA